MIFMIDIYIIIPELKNELKSFTKSPIIEEERGGRGRFLNDQ